MKGRESFSKFSDCYIWTHKIAKHNANEVLDRKRHRLGVTVFDDKNYYDLDYL